MGFLLLEIPATWCYSKCRASRGRQSAEPLEGTRVQRQQGAPECRVGIAVFAHRLMCLSTWSLDDGTVLEDCVTMARLSLAGGSPRFYSQFHFLSTLFPDYRSSVTNCQTPGTIAFATVRGCALSNLPSVALPGILLQQGKVTSCFSWESLKCRLTEIALNTVLISSSAP